MNVSGKKISILGANSYIGAHLTKYLFDLNCELFLYDQSINPIFPETNYLQFDITNPDEINKIELDVDIIFLFSGITGTSIGFEKYKDFIQVNEIGLLNLLTTMKKKGSNARIIYPSSRLIYKGIKDKKLNENSEKDLKTIYALNKFSCEEYLRIYHHCFDINYTVLRICIPYGQTIQNIISYGTINHFLSKALKGEDIVIYGDGLQKRTFIHINDLCKVLLFAGSNPLTINDTFNVGGNDILNILEVAQHIAKAFHVGIKHTEWDGLSAKIESSDTIFDSNKLDKIIKYSYQYKFTDWIKSLV